MRILPHQHPRILRPATVSFNPPQVCTSKDKEDSSCCIGGSDEVSSKTKKSGIFNQDLREEFQDRGLDELNTRKFPSSQDLEPNLPNLKTQADLTFRYSSLSHLYL